MFDEGEIEGLRKCDDMDFMQVFFCFSRVFKNKKTPSI